MKVKELVGNILSIAFKVFFVILAVILIKKGASICYDYGFRVFTEPALSSGTGKNVSVAITEDMSPFDIGAMFEEKGLVADGRLFGLQYYASEYREDVKTGIFQLSSNMTAEEMMAVMAGAGQDDEAESEDDN